MAIFYIVLAGLVTLYNIDLAFLVITAFIASVVNFFKKPKKTLASHNVKQQSAIEVDMAFALPKVLIQLPMYNEESHCDLIIRRCCEIDYPHNKMLIQVLDDSSKEAIKDKVDDFAQEMIKKGYPVNVIRRTNRGGFKAGALVEGLNRVEGRGFKYVAIFDADFEPPKDFLRRTVQVLESDDKIGFVQTRWTFTNVTSFLTWCQKVNLNFHFCVEQLSRSFTGSFFNFNGTAGVWRIECINSSGGWQSDTVVEDMDLSLRAYLAGWKFAYLHNVKCPNELPSTFSAYRTQQFRWLAGPMQIFRKSMITIFSASDVSFMKKLSCYIFFLRYILFSIITFAVLAVPLYELFVEKWTWSWDRIYFMSVINAPSIFYLYISIFSVPFMIFSISVGYFKTVAMISGFLNLESSKGWKVTPKFGTNSFLRRFKKPYLIETLLCAYYIAITVLAFLRKYYGLGGYCALMSGTFLMTAFGDVFL